MSIVILDGHSITLENEDKIFFPDGITKGMLLTYYQQIAPILLPFIQNRAITMDRFPDGISGKSFYEKNAPAYFPSWIKTIAIAKKSGGHDDYVICKNAATLIYIVNQACITPHMWLSRIDDLNCPDRIIFDLDPATETNFDFKLICNVALALKSIIEQCGLTAWVMTTGSRGLHVRVPIKPEFTFDEIRNFARYVASYVVAQAPDKVTLESRKEKRNNRLLIDIMRNGFGATGVVPYAVRAHPKAPVATPLHWNDLKTLTSSQAYSITTIFDQLKNNGKPWQDMQRHARSVKKAITSIKKLSKLDK